MQEALDMKEYDSNNNLDYSNNNISEEDEDRHADPVEKDISEQEEISDDDDSDYEEFAPDSIKSTTDRQNRI
jgi:hypothetical protein